MPVKGKPESLYIGVELSNGGDLASTLDKICEMRLDFAAVPLSKTKIINSIKKNNTKNTLNDDKIKNYFENASAQSLIQPLYSDQELSSSSWKRTVIATIPYPYEYKFEKVEEQNSSLFSNIQEKDSLIKNSFSSSTLSNVSYISNILLDHLSWATHVGVHAILCPFPQLSNPFFSLADYTETLLQFIFTRPAPLPPFWIRLPMVYKQEVNSVDKISIDTWETWNTIRTLCSYSNQVEVVLEINDLPKDPFSLDRWLAEPIKAVILPISLFIYNAKGYPVLPIPIKQFLCSLFEFQVHVILKVDTEINSSPSKFLSQNNLNFEITKKDSKIIQQNNIKDTNNFTNDQSVWNKGNEIFKDANLEQIDKSKFGETDSTSSFDLSFIEPYRNYVARLFTSLPPLNEIEEAEFPYYDCLQIPLQPLFDNLESQIYETFERDPVKYRYYKNAILAFLKDHLKNLNEYDMFSENDNIFKNSKVDFSIKKESKVDSDLDNISNQAFSNYSSEPRYDDYKNLNKLDEISGNDTNNLSSNKTTSTDPFESKSNIENHHLLRELSDINVSNKKSSSINLSLEYSSEVQSLLQNKEKENTDNNSSFLYPERPVVIYIVGAGRGPLVHASLLALYEENITNYKVIAIEKNKNAIFTLQNRKLHDPEPMWKNVEVLYMDMRIPKPELANTADLVISELLGSFGDNELSPECLEGAKYLLKRGTGVFMPSSYTSYLEPISTPILWKDKQNNPNHWETTYVVSLHAYYPFSNEGPKPCFTFTHYPPEGVLSDNDELLLPFLSSSVPLSCDLSLERSKCLSFTAKNRAVLHGFAGYFDCVLYKDIKLSIHPNFQTPGLFSWFPLYLPIRVPQIVDVSTPITLQIWRKTDAYKVWYEWCMISPNASIIHNPNGRAQSIKK